MAYIWFPYDKKYAEARWLSLKVNDIVVPTTSVFYVVFYCLAIAHLIGCRPLRMAALSTADDAATWLRKTMITLLCPLRSARH